MEYMSIFRAAYCNISEQWYDTAGNLVAVHGEGQEMIEAALIWRRIESRSAASAHKIGNAINYLFAKHMSVT